ncbi:hypothetical protein JWG39_06215 [Desulforhopalus vacuolatus]|uniref:hypothetical protein n=1 Tax=Desulforhopalus vacuolatus TaxID=40414 RepID=UPI001965E56F|nr:hypothetical protein [Desulforhopalus vacuolatus]MBM9519414.1 hypothetical protein [Desulforhopalus vacuolatus]
MKKIILTSSVILACLLFSGCTHNPDPRQGGLFGYSPNLYQQRIDQKNAELQSVEENTAVEGGKTVSLESDVFSERLRVSKLQQKVNKASRNIKDLQRRLDRMKFQSSKAEKTRAELEKKLASLQNSFQRSSAPKGDIARQEAEIKSLESQLLELMKEAELLGTL